MRKLRHTAYAYYFKKITIVGARLPRPMGWETYGLTPTMSRLVVGNADLRSLRNAEHAYYLIRCYDFTQKIAVGCPSV